MGNFQCVRQAQLRSFRLHRGKYHRGSVHFWRAGYRYYPCSPILLEEWLRPYDSGESFLNLTGQGCQFACSIFIVVIMPVTVSQSFFVASVPKGIDYDCDPSDHRLSCKPVRLKRLGRNKDTGAAILLPVFFLDGVCCNTSMGCAVM